MPRAIVLCMFLLFGCCNNLAGCAFGHRLLEFKDVQFIKIRETKTSPTISLEISGLAFHSALAVEKIEVVAEDSTETVLIHLVLVRKGLGGSFDYEFSVPNNINEVRFGPDKHLIWKRGVGPIMTK